MPPFQRHWAFFLDIDGTLLDIAATPKAVHTARADCRLIAALYEKSAGALALVSGRSLKMIDQLFSPMRLPAAGQHGVERRAEGEGERRQDEHHAERGRDDRAARLRCGGEGSQQRERERSLYRASVEVLAATIDAKDPHTHDHSRKVARYARLLAEAMELEKQAEAAMLRRRDAAALALDAANAAGNVHLAYAPQGAPPVTALHVEG